MTIEGIEFTSAAGTPNVSVKRLGVPEHATLFAQAQASFESGQFDLTHRLISKLSHYRSSLTVKDLVELNLLSGKSLRAHGEFCGARQAFEEALMSARESGLHEFEAHALNQLASIHTFQGDDDAALEALEQAGKIFEALGLKTLLATTLTNMGSVYLELADYEDALSSSQKAYELLKKLAPRSRTASVNLQNLGATYSALGQFTQAQRLLQEAIAIANELGDKELSIAGHIVIGEVYVEAKQLEAAKASFKTAEQESKISALTLYQIGAVRGLGDVYFENAQYSEAKIYHEEAIALARAIEDPINVATGLLGLVEDELALGFYEAAIEHAQAALSIAGQTERTGIQYQAHSCLAEAYKAQGDFEKTVYHLETYHRLRESVFNKENAEKTRRLSIKFDLEKTRYESEMYRLKSEISAQAQEEAERLVQERTAELENAQLEIVNRLAVAAEYRDDDTGAHTRRVGRNAALMAYAMGWSLRNVQLLYTAARLHDIGKIGISDKILLKPGSLTKEELETIKTHTLIGELILADGHSPLLNMAEVVAVAHHERWDGNGYPKGLVGTAIPSAARIVSVADVLDALTHERPYKRAWSVEKALNEIQTKSATQFDPEVVKACMSIFGEAGPLSPLEVAESWQALVTDLEKIEQLRSLKTKTAEPVSLSSAR